MTGEVRQSYKQSPLPSKQSVIQSPISILGAKNLLNCFERVRERGLQKLILTFIKIFQIVNFNVNICKKYGMFMVLSV